MVFYKIAQSFSYCQKHCSYYCKNNQLKCTLIFGLFRRINIVQC